MTPDELVTPVDLRCSVVVLRKDTVLLLNRTSGTRSDWVLPGGNPHPGESTGACARREVWEETGLDVNPARCAFVLEVTDPAQERRIVELVFLGQLLSDGDAAVGEPGAQPVWVSMTELAGINLRPPIGGYLAGLARGSRDTAPYLGNMWRPEDI